MCKNLKLLNDLLHENWLVSKGKGQKQILKCSNKVNLNYFTELTLMNNFKCRHLISMIISQTFHCFFPKFASLNDSTWFSGHKNKNKSKPDISYPVKDEKKIPRLKAKEKDDYTRIK